MTCPHCTTEVDPPDLLDLSPDPIETDCPACGWPVLWEPSEDDETPTPTTPWGTP